MNPVVHGNYDAISRRAFENYIVELVRNYAVEQERLEREVRKRDKNVLVREVQLSGEYPDTAIRIRRYDRIREVENWQTFSLWNNPDIFDKQGKPFRTPEQIAGDMLMYARGG